MYFHNESMKLSGTAGTLYLARNGNINNYLQVFTSWHKFEGLVWITHERSSQSVDITSMTYYFTLTTIKFQNHACILQMCAPLSFYMLLSETGNHFTPTYEHLAALGKPSPAKINSSLEDGEKQSQTEPTHELLLPLRPSLSFYNTSRS